MLLAATLISPFALIAMQAAPSDGQAIDDPAPTRVPMESLDDDVEVVPPDGVPPDTDAETIAADETPILDDRRRPGIQSDLPDRVVQDNPGAVRAPPPEAFYRKYDGSDADLTLDVGLPDRARITSSLCPATGSEAIYDLYPNLRAVCRPKTNPFAHNLLKGDRPLGENRPDFLKGDDWYLILTGISDTVVEPRSFPIPVGVQTTERPDSLDVFGRSESLVLAQTFIAGVSLLKGMTAFKPPTVEYRLTLAGQMNYVDVPERRVLEVEPSKNTQRTDVFLGVQEAFVDYHLAKYDNARFDFISVRAGIQPWQSDFRGFLFQDSQLGFRLFGNRDNNRWQFNVAAFLRLEKDTNSGLNAIFQTPRQDYVVTANAYRQDFPFVGLTSTASITWNANREADDIEVDTNGFPVRPALLGTLRGRDYDVFYLGYGFDGHLGRLNLTGQLYGALGEDRASFFTGEDAKIRAGFAAVEASYDVDYWRFRLSGLYATGDSDSYDDVEGGFDAIFENPIFAGADTSYWIRQTIPFAGGGRAVAVNGRNGILNSLRSSKEQGQSNFNNPGTVLLGAGFDADLTPGIRLSGNWNHLWFDNTSSLQNLRVEGSIPKTIGHDVSLAGIWRPWENQNAVMRLSAAVFVPTGGFDDLFAQAGDDDRFYSVLANATFAF